MPVFRLGTIEEEAPDAPLNDDVLRGIAASGGARQPEADEASVVEVQATSGDLELPAVRLVVAGD